MLSAGTKFGRYIVVRALGKGGMGTVYLVRHEVLDAYFALKVLPTDVAMRNSQFIPRFLREAKLCCRIRHPNLVSVHDAGRDETSGLYYLVMDYAPGGNLREKLEAAGGRLDARVALDIIRSLASALTTASEFGLVHRDIKPENIMFGPKGEAKLADLGIAKSSDDSTLMTMENAVFGTPAYMSPEQACDSGKVDARADIYSLGIVFFEMLCGCRPYDGPSTMNIIAQLLSDESVPDVRKFVPEIDERIAKVVAGMCEKKVERRIASAQALLEKLDAIVGCPIEGVHEKPSSHMRVIQLLPIVSAVGVLAVLGGLGWIALREKWFAAPPHASEAVPSVDQPVPAEDVASVPEAAVPAEKTNSVEQAAIPATPAESVSTETSGWRPPPPATVLQTRDSEMPAAAAVQEPDPPPEPIEPGAIVVLGGENDDVAATKSRLGATAFRSVENAARIDGQLDTLCAARPQRVYLKLAADAAAGGMSENGFDNLIRKVANRLRDNGVPFEFVLEPETEKTRPYNRQIREVCNSLSYGISEK